MQTTHLIGMLIAIQIIGLLAMAIASRITAEKARATGYDEGYDDARNAQLARIELLQGELDDLSGLAADLETARRLERDELIQDADRRIAIYASRSNPFTEADLLTLQTAAEQLGLLSRTFHGFGSTNNATQASHIAQQTLNMAERLRAALAVRTAQQEERTLEAAA